MTRQRHLHEDAGDIRIGVEAHDEIHELLLRRLLGKLEVPRRDAALLAVAKLGTYVRGGALVVSHEHHGKTAGNPLLGQALNLGCRAVAHVGSKFLTIDNRRQ